MAAARYVATIYYQTSPPPSAVVCSTAFLLLLPHRVRYKIQWVFLGQSALTIQWVFLGQSALTYHFSLFSAHTSLSSYRLHTRYRSRRRCSACQSKVTKHLLIGGTNRYTSFVSLSWEIVNPLHFSLLSGYLFRSEKTDEQILVMTNERITVPEALFTPLDVGIPQAGIAEAVQQALHGMPPEAQALYLQRVSGGFYFMHIHHPHAMPPEARTLL